MRRRPGGFLLVLLLGLDAATAQAGVQPVPAATELITRYRALAAGPRSDVLRNLERRFAREDYELLQRIQGLQKGKAAYANPSVPVWFEPRDYAPQATPRSAVGIGSASHRQATRGMRPFVCLPDLNAAVVYDWLSGQAVHLGRELDEVERFSNYAYGFAPFADHAIALVLAALDAEPRQRSLGHYFEHLYADRNGTVFQKTSLYEAWRSGQQMEMPDTDAIAYARHVLGTHSFVAPLPADRRRDRLYAKMRDGFAEHRDHRTLLLALAATFVTARPQLEAGYEGLIDRAHWLWLDGGFDPKVVGERLRGTADRGELFQRIDAALPQHFDAVTTQKQALDALANYLRTWADQELRAAGG